MQRAIMQPTTPCAMASAWLGSAGVRPLTASMTAASIAPSSKAAG